LKSNLVTGFMSGYYMYFRKVYNDITLKRIAPPSPQYRAANFYFIREYCYGSMFRYNASGEFNIPYGGMSYNGKNLRSKIDAMFTQNVASIFRNTEICCSDFEAFLTKAALTDQDFIFLDPPYDTDFSDYEGRDFTRKDQERLAHVLANTPAKFILIIKSTEFICNLYGDRFRILSFDNQYTYNVRSRNDRSAEHLIITNLPVS
ncbi:MAG: DNA adenine methylase, partial [Pseudoflavonifractor sp.]